MSNNDTKPSFLFPKWDLQQVSSSLFLPLAALVVRWCPMQEGQLDGGLDSAPFPFLPRHRELFASGQHRAKPR